MSTRLTCPGCHRVLLLPSDCTAETVSCPRCLALIPNPQAAPGPTAVQETLPPAPAPAAVPPSAVTKARLRAPEVDVDVEVRRDTRRTSGCMIALAVLGAVGLIYTVLGSAALAKGGVFQPLMVVLAILTVATLISVARVYADRPSESTARNIGRTVLSVLTISGVLVATALLLIGAGVIFLLVICISHGGKC
jgi:hypothetical protein